MLEIVPVVDFDTLDIKAWAEREWATRHGLCRLTTLLMPVRFDDGFIAVQTRPIGKSCAGMRDFFGGGVCLEKESWGFLLGRPLGIQSLFLSTAIRETNEELRMADSGGLLEFLNTENVNNYLFQIENVGSFPLRREQRSTLYLVRIPRGSSINPMDDVHGKFVAVKTEFHSLDAILQKYDKQEWQFADGAGRVLRRLKEEGNLLRSVRELMETMCS